MTVPSNSPGPAVDFLIAGVQKAGTSTLHDMLRRHPQVYMPARKELHFFDDEQADWRQPDYAGYEALFRNRSSGQKAGEATPVYSYWPGCVERIHVYNPSIKLILSIRDPADRAFSHWSMEFGRGFERLPFAQAIRAGRSRVAANGGRHRHFSYVERGFYACQIEEMLLRFGKRQVLVVRLAQLRTDPNGLLDTVCAFLGVPAFRDHPAVPVLNASNPDAEGASMDRADRRYLVGLFRDDIVRTQEMTGLNLSDWLN